MEATVDISNNKEEQGPDDWVMLFDVTFSPEEGDLVVTFHRPTRDRRRERLRELGRTTSASTKVSEGAVRSTPIGASRAFHSVRRHAMRNDLRTHATLEFDDHHKLLLARRHLSAAMRGLRRELGEFPYVAVHERGEIANKLHWHVLLPIWVPRRSIEGNWDKGEVHYKQAPTYDDLERLVIYVTKGFGDTERFFTTRYSMSRGFRGRRVKVCGVTKEEIDVLVEQLAGTNLDTVTYLQSPNDFVAGIYRWNPAHIPKGR